MRRFLLGVAMAVTASMAQANDAIESVIGDQLQAFNDRDVEGAWGYASPMIQGLFGNPVRFGAMVQQGYPMVWDNNDVRFLDLREAQGAQQQRVMIRDDQGGLHMLEYQMLETPDGWQIDGVQLLLAPDVGA